MSPETVVFAEMNRAHFCNSKLRAYIEFFFVGLLNCNPYIIFYFKILKCIIKVLYFVFLNFEIRLNMPILKEISIF